MVQLVAVPRLVAQIGEETAVEGVGARTQDQVERAAGEIAFFDVGRDRLHGHLFDGFERDRTQIGRQAAGVQAEIVVRAHAVDGDAVGARRRAGDIETTRRACAAGIGVKLGQRVAAGGFADITLDRDSAFDRRAAEARA